MSRHSSKAWGGWPRGYYWPGSPKLRTAFSHRRDTCPSFPLPSATTDPKTIPQKRDIYIYTLTLISKDETQTAPLPLAHALHSRWGRSPGHWWFFGGCLHLKHTSFTTSVTSPWAHINSCFHTKCFAQSLSIAQEPRTNPIQGSGTVPHR